MRVWKFAFVLFFAAVAVSAAPMATLKVEDGKLTAAGQEIRLRGLNWGWWNLKGTVYTEQDMRRQAEWGANVARLALSIDDVFHRNWSLNAEALARIDAVVEWAGRHGQYVILDIHEAPGGQTPILYCDGGYNKLWSDPASQERWIAMLTELARRYRDVPAVAAYELINEPCTVPRDAALLAELNRRAIRAIREVDPDKVIVVSGDNWSHADTLDDLVKQEDDNILYTIHYYEGTFPVWLRNLSQEPAFYGTRDWFRTEFEFTVPADAEQISILLRSTNNTGRAWFDDLTVTDARGDVVKQASFDRDTEGFGIERAAKGFVAYDPAVGHTAPGSLMVRETPDYNGWKTDPFLVTPGERYRVSVWMKLENATGSSHIVIPLFRRHDPTLDDMLESLRPAYEFARRHNVPVWIGEFGMERNHNPDFQQQVIANRIKAFEKYGFHWTYWNYRETTHPESMALVAQKRDGSGDHPVNPTLLETLREGWKKNRPASR